MIDLVGLVYGAPTQFRSYGANQEILLCLSSGVTKFKEIPGIKTTPLAGDESYKVSNSIIFSSRDKPCPQLTQPYTATPQP